MRMDYCDRQPDFTSTLVVVITVMSIHEAKQSQESPMGEREVDPDGKQR